MLGLLTTIFTFVSGAVLGSFLNVVTLRSTKAPITGRSQCPHCRTTLSWFELIPLLSFTLQRGRCRNCGHTISVQYPLVELAVGISALIIFTSRPYSPAALAWGMLDVAIIAVLLALFIIDLRTFLLPDKFIIALTALVVVRFFLQPTTYGVLPHQAFGGAIIGTGFLALLWVVTGGRGLGLGDVKLMLPLGALFGPSATTLLLFVAFIAGGFLALTLLATRRVTMKTPIPFGPFLAGTAIILLLMPYPAVTTVLKFFTA